MAALGLALAALIGLSLGLLGGGGSILTVPIFVYVLGFGAKEAIAMSLAVAGGTSLLVIAMKSAAGFYGYLGQVEVPWAFMGLFALISIVGTFAGTYLVRFVSQAQLKRFFAVFLVVMGVFILWQNRGVVLPEQEQNANPAVAADH